MSGFETRAIHAAQDPDPVTGAVVPPISLATTFAQDGVGKHRGYEYSRSGNPTRSVYEAVVANLEGAAHGMAFASGLAAEDAVLRLLSPGDHVLLPPDAYGGTFRLVTKVHGPAGIRYGTTWDAATKLVWIETPSNPYLNVVDIAATAKAAHERGALLVVDNTFATPYLQQPLDLGADIVVHSATKYLGGHSDVVGGFLAVDDVALAERLGYIQNAAGAVPSPFDCYMALRGVKTLAVRMDRHVENAALVVDLLSSHPAVSKVLWPGLPDHPGHEIASRQMKAPGGMVSFLVAAGEEAAVRVAESTELFTLAESLGAVESLIEHPARMTHASVAESEFAVDPSLVRLSVGIESAADLVADLSQALDQIT